MFDHPIAVAYATAGVAAAAAMAAGRLQLGK